MEAGVAIGGGLLLSVSIPRSLPHSKLPSGFLNAYIRIDPSGRVTLTMPKVEMGQGTCTALPMLIAEELEVDLNSIALEAAPANPQVYGFDGDQSTGGSTTIRECWLPLRKAARRRAQCWWRRRPSLGASHPPRVTQFLVTLYTAHRVVG
jgi:isoquinoline 1-oxidoreductase subunit beta